MGGCECKAACQPVQDRIELDRDNLVLCSCSNLRSACGPVVSQCGCEAGAERCGRRETVLSDRSRSASPKQRHKADKHQPPLVIYDDTAYNASQQLSSRLNDTALPRLLSADRHAGGRSKASDKGGFWSDHRVDGAEVCRGEKAKDAGRLKVDMEHGQHSNAYRTFHDNAHRHLQEKLTDVSLRTERESTCTTAATSASPSPGATARRSPRKPQRSPRVKALAPKEQSVEETKPVQTSKMRRQASFASDMLSQFLSIGKDAEAGPNDVVQTPPVAHSPTDRIIDRMWFKPRTTERKATPFAFADVSPSSSLVPGVIRKASRKLSRKLIFARLVRKATPYTLESEYSSDDSRI